MDHMRANYTNQLFVLTRKKTKNRPLSSSNYPRKLTFVPQLRNRPFSSSNFHDRVIFVPGLSSSATLASSSAIPCQGSPRRAKRRSSSRTARLGLSSRAQPSPPAPWPACSQRRRACVPVPLRSHVGSKPC